jgi:hypothetical protein
MTEKLGENIGEMNLFHGTPDLDTVRCICNQNFDCRVSGRHGTKWGDGAYFAHAASFSHNYTRATPPIGKRFMFMALVLVGRFAQGAHGMKRPPPVDGTKKHGVLCDSVVDNAQRPRTYVIFNNDQAYPMYLIEYIQTPPAATQQAAAPPVGLPPMQLQGMMPFSGAFFPKP